jgi:hypothetical protein
MSSAPMITAFFMLLSLWSQAIGHRAGSYLS